MLSSSKTKGTLLSGILSATLCLYLALVYLLSPDIIYYPDALRHFWISNGIAEDYSLMLDHWGKPLFSIVAYPFSLIGLKGLVVLNIILAWIVVWMLNLIVRYLNWSPWLGPVGAAILIFSPEFFLVVFSGLTEVLFATILIVVVWLLLKEKHNWAALLAGFLLFSRPESSLVLICLIVFLITQKKFRSLIYLPIAFLLFALLGWFIIGDIRWFQSTGVYDPEGSAYGSGEILHFVRYFPGTLGVTLALLFGLGVVISLVDLRNPGSRHTFFWWLMIVAPAIGVLAVHSFIWWKGIYGSAGLMRVLITVAPLYILLALRSIHFIHIKAHPVFAVVVVVIAIGWQVKQSLNIYPLPVEAGPRDEMISNAGEELKPILAQYDTIYAMEPFLMYWADRNVVLDDHIFELYRAHSTKGLKPLGNQSVLIWDSQFGPQEGKTPLSLLTNEKQLKLTKAWTPESPVTTFGQFFEIYCFEPGENPGVEIEYSGNWNFENLRADDSKPQLLIDFPLDTLSSGSKLVTVTAQLNYNNEEFPKDLKFISAMVHEGVVSFQREWPEDSAKLPEYLKRDIRFHFTLNEARDLPTGARFQISIQPRHAESLNINDFKLEIHPVEN